MISVLIIEPNAGEAKHTQTLLMFEPDFKVVGVIDSATTVLDILETVATERPDIVLMNLGLPDGDGFALAVQLLKNFPAVAVIMMSPQPDTDTLKRAMLAGARDFLETPIEAEKLYETVRRVYESFAPIRHSYGSATSGSPSNSYNAAPKPSQPKERTEKEIPDIDDVLSLPPLPSPIIRPPKPVVPMPPHVTDEDDDDEVVIPSQLHLYILPSMGIDQLEDDDAEVMEEEEEILDSDLDDEFVLPPLPSPIAPPKPITPPASVTDDEEDEFIDKEATDRFDGVSPEPESPIILPPQPAPISPIAPPAPISPIAPPAPTAPPSVGISENRPEELSTLLENLAKRQALTDGLSAGESPESPAPTKPVFFSAYYPREAQAERKNGLYIYAHLEDALATIQKDVEKFKEELGGSIPQPRTAKQSAHIAENTPITIIPESEDIEFEPASLTKRWREPFTRFDFDFFPSKTVVDDSVVIRVSVQINGIEIASIKCGIDIIEGKMTPVSQPITDENPLASARFTHQQAETYRKIFISYSRKDTAVARAYQMAQLAMGNEVFLDVDSLRAGENWQAALARAIDSADIFQMFWSSSYAESQYCRYEWDYALRYRCPDQSCEGFIRPVYWVNPMPAQPPAELGHLNFKYVPFSLEP